MADEPVSRRTLIRGSVITVVAGVAGYAIARNSGAAERKRTTTAANAYGYGGAPSRKKLAALSAVPAGGGLVLANDDVVLTRDQAGTVHAFSATCTHQGCTVTEVTGGQIICPCHGSKFAASSGAVTAGPAPRPLPSIAVTVEGDTIFTG